MKQYDVHKVMLPCGEEYAYRKAGSGSPKGEGKTVILIHGNLSSSVHWQTTMEALEAEYIVYAPDLRGFGDSSYNREFNSLKELANELGEFTDALGIGGCYLVGWSTGGGVAMEFAADRPEQVKGLTLLDSVPPTGFPMFKKGPDFQPILTEPLVTKDDVASDPVQVVPAVNALKAGDRSTIQHIWNLTIFNLNKPSDEDTEVFLDGIMKQRCPVDVAYSLLTFNITDRLQLIKCPITIMHGEKDMVVPLAWAQMSFPLYGGNVKTVIFENAGHSPINDVPDDFFAALRTALETV
jgi:pimeloyl-ACP methyl ester carboxylesterase